MDTRHSHSIETKDPGSIAAIVQKNADAIFFRDKEQATPLAAAIKENSVPCITALLNVGAAESVFVHGYTEGSLVCTLPMALQPESSVFQHPEPLRNIDPCITDALDEFLSAHVKKMVAGEEAKATRMRLLAEKGKRRKDKSSTILPGFNHYPPSLSIGDIGIKTNATNSNRINNILTFLLSCKISMLTRLHHCSSSRSRLDMVRSR
jgi:hypothetical protein